MLLKLVFSNFVFILYSVIFYVTLQTTMKLVKVKFQKSEWAEIKKKFARDVFVKRCIHLMGVFYKRLRTCRLNFVQNFSGPGSRMGLSVKCDRAENAVIFRHLKY